MDLYVIQGMTEDCSVDRQATYSWTMESWSLGVFVAYKLGLEGVIWRKNWRKQNSWLRKQIQICLQMRGTSRG